MGKKAFKFHNSILAFVEKSSRSTKILIPTHMTNGQNKFPAPLFVFLRRPKVCIDVSVRYEVWAHAPVRAHVGFFVYFGTTPRIHFHTHAAWLRVRRTYANFRIHSPRRTAADQITAIEVIISLRVESIFEIFYDADFIYVFERERKRVSLMCVSAALVFTRGYFDCHFDCWICCWCENERQPLRCTLYLLWIVKAFNLNSCAIKFATKFLLTSLGTPTPS
jgi:hypothetical protein